MARKLLFALPVLLCACAQDPVTDYLGGFGDPVRGAALNAPRNLSDTSRYRGDPAGAAIAAAQLEFLLRSFREDPIRAPQTNPSAVFALQEGVREMRAALGIAPDAPGALVERQLREAAQALRTGSPARAEAALALPAFAAGPAETLRRLGALPRLSRVADAAGAAAQELARQDQGRLGIRF